MDVRWKQSALLLVGLAASGCYGGRTSPAVYGVDLRIAPGFSTGSDDVTIHPTVAYARSLFGGVEGETDGVLHLGGQVRFATSPSTAEQSGFWFGGEVTYARRSTAFDLVGVPDETTNGWTLAALAGVPVLTGSAGVAHGYAALGLNKYGGTGPYARVGLDLQPAFLRR